MCLCVLVGGGGRVHSDCKKVAGNERQECTCIPLFIPVAPVFLWTLQRMDVSPERIDQLVNSREGRDMGFHSTRVFITNAVGLCQRIL